MRKDPHSAYTVFNKTQPQDGSKNILTAIRLTHVYRIIGTTSTDNALIILDGEEVEKLALNSVALKFKNVRASYLVNNNTDFTQTTQARTLQQVALAI